MFNKNESTTHLPDEPLFYLSRTIAHQGERGADWNFNLKVVYGVFFMNFCLDNQPHKLRTDVILADRETHEPFSDKLRFIFLELPAFDKKEEECMNDFERWIYVLKNMETLKRLPFKARKSVFEKLEAIVDIASLSKEEREKYDESIKVYRDNQATMAYAKEYGLAKGRAQGREEGLVKARTLIARNLKAIGMDTAAIQKTTGLTLEEIQKL